MALWNPKHEQQPAAEAAPVPSRVTEPQPPARDQAPPTVAKQEPVAPAPVPSGDLLLGAGAEFDGKLTFRGTVRIDAKFKGSIFTNDVLVVGEHAKIDADITCGTVIVYGEVNGNIKAKTAVELHHPAKLKGNVESPSLAIDKGVVFQGESKMGPVEKGSSVRAVSSTSASSSAPAPL